MNETCKVISPRKSQISFIEVSRPIEAGMTTYPGLPAPKAEIFLDYEQSKNIYHNQSEFLISSLHLCGNTGTYVDSPCHRYREGIDLAKLPLSSLAHLSVVTVDATQYPERGINSDIFQNLDLQNKAVLIRTDWSKHGGTKEYFSPHPFLKASTCEFLVHSKVKFVGIDSLNIDDTKDMSRPAHTILLGANIPICEHMTNLENIPIHDAYLHAVPIAWVGGATFPVRAYIMH